MSKKFENFLTRLFEVCNQTVKFDKGAEEIENYINELSFNDFLEIVEQIGTIPEVINASSSEEKMFSKASDIVLARCFRELGLSSIAVKGRGDSADIVAKSEHGYSLVADSKTFRLSRTAKNQKDFKINALSAWRGADHEYCVLVCPYFQYPNTESQIYFDALMNNVCLLSWEHILFLLKKGIKENLVFTFEQIWDSSNRIQRDHNITLNNRKQNIFKLTNPLFFKRCGFSLEDFDDFLETCKNTIMERAKSEIIQIETEVEEICSLSHEEAIDRLIAAKKINERIDAIKVYCSSLRR